MNALKSFWQKNGSELTGFFNGGLPPFVRQLHPTLPLNGLPVFCYHLVAEENFRGDLQFLRDNDFRTLHGQDLNAVLLGEKPPGPRDIVLTFDDGALNTYEVAHPCLMESGYSAMLFVCPGLIREAPPDDTRERLCTWSELRELRDSGCWDIQCHTWAHRSIPHWPKRVPLTGVKPETLPERSADPDTLAEDLKQSRHKMHQELGYEPLHLAWPQYVSTPDAIQQASDAGYSFCWGGLQPGKGVCPVPVDRASRSDLPRMGADFLRRLPGKGRRSLLSLALSRCSAKLKQ